ncbi:hypothetical protein CEB3_c00490 [Peptococcaceae bacterium CEB3]|nr:hypothetical protein CEB3_c00490 [Peptococcaceae bacterium CEB3]
MKKTEWYLLVIMAIVLLTISFLKHNTYLAVGTFVLVIYLQRFIKDIPLPKQFQKYKIVSRKSKKL